MNAEEKLILSLLKRMVSGPEFTEPVETLIKGSSPDWQRLKDLAAHHEIVPFLYQGLKEKQGLVPDDSFSFLRNTYYCTLTRNQYLIDQAMDIFAEFERRDVPLLPLKGIALLKEIYAQRPVRTMTDIDLLVRLEDLGRAEKLFGGIGYRKELYGLKEEYFKEKESHFPFYTKSPKRFSTYVELHFSILADKTTKAMMPGMWRRIRRLEDAQGDGLWALSPEDTLLAHALHQRKFGKMFCLKYTVDTALLLAKYRSRFDWGYLLSKAKEARISSSLFFLLWQTKTFLGTMIPQEIEKGLSLPGWKKRLIISLIEKNTFLLPAQIPVKKLYLRCHFLLYDTIRQPLYHIIDVPQEQFAKFYGLQPYDKKTAFWHKYRFLYIPLEPLLRNYARPKPSLKENLSKDGLSLYKTGGFSMWPFLKPDERLLVKPVSPGQLKAGDIVLYKDPNPSPWRKDGKPDLVCHRLIKKSKTDKGYKLFVRADNSLSRPEMIPETNLKGKAVALLRNKSIINLESRQRHCINRVILFIAPLISRLVRTARTCHIRLAKKIK